MFQPDVARFVAFRNKCVWVNEISKLTFSFLFKVCGSVHLQSLE